MRIQLFLLAVACPAACPVGAQTADDPAVLLDPLHVQGERPEASQRLLPLDSDVAGIFGPDTDVLDVPRAVTVVTPELLYQTGVENFDELDKVGAGTARVNFFGIAGTPFLRGVLAGIYYDGMLRAYQRNEMPTSFGSLEALDIVKGPAPAHLDPTLVGGYVDMVPKSPYFGETRGSVSATVGSWDKYRAQLDYGGPMTLLGQPAAYRVSLTGQRAGSYYNNVRNDFLSLYAALIVRTGEDSTFFTGGEYYRFKSGEVPGWNRPTQDLIDHGQYVIGEGIDLTDPQWNGTANRTLVSFPSGYGWSNGIQDFQALVVPRDVVQQALSAGKISQAAVSSMLDMTNADDRARAYGQPLPSTGQRDPHFDASGNASLDATLARLMAKSSDTGYRYTQAYFDNGGITFTAPIKGSQVLADPRDYANSQDVLWFTDWKKRPDTGGMLRNQTYMERLETRKLSTYGFSLYMDQLVATDKLTVQTDLEALRSRLTFGGELRYAWARMRQDFFAEPFSRRDLTRPDISANSVVETGPQIAPDGLNLWSPGLGANAESDLYQGSLFALLDTRLGDRLRIFTGLRGESVKWDTRLPREVERYTQAIYDATRTVGWKQYANGSINPTFRLTSDINLYAAAQVGTAMGPGDGGTIDGRSSFTHVRLYEAGIKAALLDKSLFLTLDAYEWKQDVWSEVDARSFPLRGRGVEFEGTWTHGAWSVLGTFTAQRVHIESDPLGFGAYPYNEQDWALNGGIMNAGFGRPTPANPDQVQAGYPEVSAGLLAVWRGPGGFGLSGGPQWKHSFWASQDRNILLPSSLVWSAMAFYRAGPWDVSLRIENVTDEDFYFASDPVFSANTLVTKAPPRSYELRAAYSF